MVDLRSRKIGTKDILWKLLYADGLAIVAGGEAVIEKQLIEWKDMFIRLRVHQTESTFGEDGGNVGGTEKERAVNTPGWEEA